MNIKFKKTKKGIGSSISNRYLRSQMEKQEIIEQVRTMKTVEELASILDTIKQNEFGLVRYGISGCNVHRNWAH